MTNTFLILLPIALFLVMLMGLSLWAERAGRRNRFAGEYFLGDRSLKGFVLAMTLVATYGSVSSFVSGPGLAWQLGLGWVVFAAPQIIAGFLILGVAGKKMAVVSRAAGALTVIDMIRARYGDGRGGRTLAALLAVLMLVFFTTMMIGQFIGGAQIDPYGNVNSTCIYGKGDYVKPQTRFTGSGGANGIATYCNTIIMMQHQKRRFMEKIDYITSCGWMDGPGGRERAGLPGNRGPQMVVTDLGIMKFDEETKRMYLAYYYPFSSPEMVQENTGFEVDVSRAELMEGPGPEIIKLIREEIDPGQAFIKVPKE